MPTPEELKKLALQNPGQLQTGATDPLTGQTFQSFAPNIINSDVLTPAPALPYITPQSQAAYPVASLDSSTPTLQPTTPEIQANDFTTQLQKLNEQLIGQSAYTAQQEKAQGIPDLQKTQTDLSAQLKGLQNEALAIPLQLQNEARGRGITVGGLAPIQAGKLRENAIKALTVSSLLESSRGNLATAQTLVDRAVAQKFDPIKEEIAVKTANLDLILKSPAYSLADKKRAQAQKDIQDAKLKKTEKEEADQKSILATATEAAKNGADALTLQKIQQAKTPIEAVVAAGSFMDNIKLDTSIQEVGDKKLLINNQTGATIKDLGSSNDIVNSLIKEYPDAGITLTDTLSQAQAKLKSSKIYQKSVKATGTGGGGGGVSGVLSGLTKSIVDNPSLFDDLTPTNRGKVLSELQANGYDTSNLGVKGLSDTAIKEISQTQKALSDLADLKEKINSNLEFVGPISGLQKINPFSKARQVQADVDRVRQTVGKALEGGVLRKEDEEKYKKILATLTDTPETAIYKIDALTSSIQRDIESYKSLQQSSGRSVDVGASLQKKNTNVTVPIEDLRKKYKY